MDVLPFALAAVSGTARFDAGNDLSTGHLADGGSVEVQTASLDALLASGDVPSPDVVKIDVEGAELDVLAGAGQLLGDTRPALILATHGADRHAACLEVLAGHGYRVQVIRETPLAAGLPRRSRRRAGALGDGALFETRRPVRSALRHGHVGPEQGARPAEPTPAPHGLAARLPAS